MTTPRDLIDAARIRHWAFKDAELPEGAALLFLNQRQRTLLAKYGAAIEGLVGVSIEIAAVLSGELVGVDANGNLFQTTSVEDGFPVHADAVTGDLYVETTDVPVTHDPFGAHGGTPGFPLPADFVRIINAVLVRTDNTLIPLDVVREELRLQGKRNPVAFVSGNRLVPARALSEGNTGDSWDSIASIQLSYIAMQTLTAMTDVIKLPNALLDALLADLADLLARQSRFVNAAEKKQFADEAKITEAAIDDISDDITRARNSVVYRG